MIDTKELTTVLDSVKYGIVGIETLLSQRDFYNKAYEQVQIDLDNIDRQLKFISDTKAFYAEAVDILYQESIGALKDTLDAALQYIMFDKDYSCNIVLEDKRGSKTLEFTLVDNDMKAEMDLKEDTGQGVRAIVSFVLKMYYLINRNSKLLFLDEKYSALSEHYIPRFFEFIKKVTEEKDMIVVMITHDTRFMNYADYGYMMNDGELLDTTQVITDEEIQAIKDLQTTSDGDKGTS